MNRLKYIPEGIGLSRMHDHCLLSRLIRECHLSAPEQSENTALGVVNLCNTITYVVFNSLLGILFLAFFTCTQIAVRFNLRAVFFSIFAPDACLHRIQSARKKRLLHDTGVASLRNPLRSLADPFADVRTFHRGLADAFALRRNRAGAFAGPFASLRNPGRDLADPFAARRRPFPTLQKPDCAQERRIARNFKQ